MYLAKHFRLNWIIYSDMPVSIVWFLLHSIYLYPKYLNPCVNTRLCIKTRASTHEFINPCGKTTQHAIFSRNKTWSIRMKTNLMFAQYVEMMTKNRYPCSLQANAQWHTSYFTYQYSWKYFPRWIPFVDKKWRMITFHKQLKTKCICIPLCRTWNWLWPVYLKYNRLIKLLVNADENIHLERWQHRMF